MVKSKAHKSLTIYRKKRKLLWSYHWLSWNHFFSYSECKERACDALPRVVLIRDQARLQTTRFLPDDCREMIHRHILFDIMFDKKTIIPWVLYLCWLSHRLLGLAKSLALASCHRQTWRATPRVLLSENRLLYLYLLFCSHAFDMSPCLVRSRDALASHTLACAWSKATGSWRCTVASALFTINLVVNNKG